MRKILSLCIALCLITPLPTTQVHAIGDVRSIDGSGNNLSHPDWGKAHTPLLRLSPPRYEDGIASPAGTNRPSPRVISNAIGAQLELIPNERDLTDMIWQWGQFIAHDTDLTHPSSVAEEFLPIEVPQGDAHLDPFNTGAATIRFSRSTFDPESGTSEDNPRAQLNAITSFIDASHVYGSDTLRAAALRTFAGGMLKTSEGNLLPFNTDGFDNEIVGPAPNFFLAGDFRANEQIALTALHVLFVREHNRLAEELAMEHPEWNDEELYQEARRIVGAQMQVVTTEEFLPALLGESLPTYSGYDPSVEPGIFNAFSTAAFRFGHMMASDRLLRLDDDGNVIPEGNLTLREASLTPDTLIATGIDPIIKGLSTGIAQEMNTWMVDGLRNIVFGPPGAPGIDIFALDIQRGRDHGLPDYNALREALGFRRHFSFLQITRDRVTRNTLRDLYDNDIDNIDAFVGMVSEGHARGSAVGPLVKEILLQQYANLRDGDRFWYENQFSAEEIDELKSTRLSDIIRRNTNLTQLQGNVFIDGPIEDPTEGDEEEEDEEEEEEEEDEEENDENDLPQLPTLPSLPSLPSLPTFPSLPVRPQSAEEEMESVSDMLKGMQNLTPTMPSLSQLEEMISIPSMSSVD